MFLKQFLRVSGGNISHISSVTGELYTCLKFTFNDTYSYIFGEKYIHFNIVKSMSYKRETKPNNSCKFLEIEINEYSSRTVF